MLVPHRIGVLILAIMLTLASRSTAIGGIEDELRNAEDKLVANRFRDAAQLYEEAAERSDLDAGDRGRAYRGLALAKLARAEPDALAALIAALIADPDYPANEWLLQELRPLLQTSGLPSSWKSAMDRMERAFTGQPRLLNVLQYLRTFTADCEGRWKNMPRLIARVKPICNLLLVGPFDNAGNSGMLTEYPPEAEIDPKITLQGLGGRAVQWMPARCSPYGVVDLDLHNDYEPDALTYAVTHVRSAAPTSARIHLAGSGAMRLWLNDELMLDETVERSDTRYLYEIPVELRDGWNRVLVKVGAERVALLLTLRITDPLGVPLDVQVSGAPPSDMPVDTPQAVQNMPPSGLERFPDAHWLKEWMRSDADLTILDRLLLSRALLGMSFLEEAEIAIESIAQRYPTCALVAELRGHLLDERGSRDAAGVWRSAYNAAPELYAARIWRLQELLGQGDFDEGITEVAAARQVFPDDAVLRAMGGLFLASRGELVAGLDRIRGTFEEHPGNLLVQGVYLKVLKSQRQQDQYEDALRTAIEARPEQPDLYREAAVAAFLRQDYDLAVELLEKALSANASPLIVCLELAETLHRAGRIKDAIAACRRGLDWAPQSDQLHNKLATLLLLKDDRRNAMVHLERALELDPSDTKTRNLLRRARGQQPLSSLFARTAIDELRGRDLDWVADDAQAVLLLDQGELSVFGSGARELRHHYAILVRSAGGVANYRTLTVPTSELHGGGLEIARVLKPDGREVEADVGFGQVAFPDLQPGDMIEVRAVTRTGPRSGLSDHFWHQNLFQGDIPCLLSRFSLLVPKGRTFESVVHNGDLAYSQTDLDEWTLHRWEAWETPASLPELNGPGTHERVTWLDISTIPSWNTLIRWFSSGSQGRLRVTPEIRRTVETILAETTTDSARVHRASLFVRTQIENEGGQFVDSPTVPRSAAEVMRSRYGDCKDQSCLLIGMLKEMDIPARFALVNSRDVTTVPYLPSPRFTHAIVQARTADGREYWIDPTAKDLAFPNVPIELEGMRALVIDPELDSPFTTIPADDISQSGTTSRIEAQISTDGALKLEGTYTCLGEDAASYREIARSMPEHIDVLIESMLSEHHPGAQVKNVEVDPGSSPDDPVVISFSLEGMATLATAGGMRIVAVPWTINPTPPDLANLADRATPLVLGDWRGRFKEEIRLVLPDGYEAVGFEPSVRLECPVGRFELTRTMEQDGTMVFERRLELDEIEIAKDGYRTFRDFLNAAIRAEREQVVFKVVEG